MSIKKDEEELVKLEKQFAELAVTIQELKLHLFNQMEFDNLEDKLRAWSNLKIGTKRYNWVLHSSQGKSSNPGVKLTREELFEYDMPPIHWERRQTLFASEIAEALLEGIVDLEDKRSAKWSSRRGQLDQSHYHEWMEWLMASNVESICMDW